MDDSDDDWSFFRRPSPPSDPMTLVAFYDCTGVDGRGRSLETILQWGTARLESSHDYIQTLFPLPEASGVNDRAPIISQQVFEAFRSRQDLKNRLREAFKKMLWFYGFEMVEEEGKVAVRTSSDFEDHQQFWNIRFDHNHLRITRIIRCLRVLGLEEEALAFYDTISCASSVSARSRVYWGRATHRPLNIRPDLSDQEADENDRRIGPKFLWDFEQEQRMLKKALLDSKEEQDVEIALRASQEPEANENTEADVSDEAQKEPRALKEVNGNGEMAGDEESKPVASTESQTPSKNLEASESSWIPKDMKLLEKPALVKGG